MSDSLFPSHSTKPTDQVAKESLERVHARVARMNRVTYLAGQMSPDELEGLILLLERAEIRAAPRFANITAEQADDALSMLNW